MHAIVAFAAVPLLLGAALSDWAYAASYHVQWTNFASWLVAGGLAVTAMALLWALAVVIGGGKARERRHQIYLLLLLAASLLGFVNALVHARDAWAAMPAGLVLSIVVLLLQSAASGVGLAALRPRSAT